MGTGSTAPKVGDCLSCKTTTKPAARSMTTATPDNSSNSVHFLTCHLTVGCGCSSCDGLTHFATMWRWTGHVLQKKIAAIITITKNVTAAAAAATTTTTLAPGSGGSELGPRKAYDNDGGVGRPLLLLWPWLLSLSNSVSRRLWNFSYSFFRFSWPFSWRLGS